MRKDIVKLVKACHVCCTTRGRTNQSTTFRYPVPEKPFDRVHIDLLTGFSETERGYKHLLVCVDALTRYTEAIPLRTKTALETAQKFYKFFICRYGIPKCLISDSGLEFKNQFMTALCEQLHIRKAQVITYHPASNGLVERANKKLLDILRVTIGNNEANWDEALPHCLWVVNTCPHRILHTSPYEALLGFVPNSPLDISLNLPQVPEPLRFDLQAANARFGILRQKLEQMDLLEKRVPGDSYRVAREVGDLVYVKKQVRGGLNYKLDCNFEGPYMIIKLLRAGRMVLERNGKTRTVTEDQVRRD